MDTSEITLELVFNLALKLKRSERARLISELDLSLEKFLIALESQEVTPLHSNQDILVDPDTAPNEV